MDAFTTDTPALGKEMLVQKAACSVVETVLKLVTEKESEESLHAGGMVVS